MALPVRWNVTEPLKTMLVDAGSLYIDKSLANRCIHTIAVSFQPKQWTLWHVRCKIYRNWTILKKRRYVPVPNIIRRLRPKLWEPMQLAVINTGLHAYLINVCYKIKIVFKKSGSCWWWWMGGISSGGSLHLWNSVAISNAGLILGLRPANERRLCIVTTYRIGWAQA